MMICLVLVTLLAGAQATPGFISSIKDKMNSTLEAIEAAGDNMKEELRDKITPIVSAVVKKATSNCELLKSMMGVDYNSTKLDNDMEKLTLEFITPSLSETYNIADAADSIPLSSAFNPSLPLFIYLHGFFSSPGAKSQAAIRNALLSIDESNLLVLDSSPYLNGFYLRATTYVQYIGEKLGEMLAAMVRHGLDPKSVHLIGHSLGAHIAGFTGKSFTQLTGLRVGRISGLDPAGPCFFTETCDHKLNATDADYVFVMHSDTEIAGTSERLGHSDFFPNNGTRQPGCGPLICSHRRSKDFFAESIKNPEAFLAVRCTGWDQFKENQCEETKVVMGFGTTSDVKGTYYLRTASDSPYGLGEEGASYTSTEGVIKSTEA